MRDTFVASLTTLAERDPRIFLITGDLGFGVLDAFARTRPRQFLNAGVAEQNMTGLAAGTWGERRARTEERIPVPASQILEVHFAHGA